MNGVSRQQARTLDGISPFRRTTESSLGGTRKQMQKVHGTAKSLQTSSLSSNRTKPPLLKAPHKFKMSSIQVQEPAILESASTPQNRASVG